ncbi:hypothetical protein ACJMK2_007476 [Sinanodonta woodiana]|uniref:G-protein coupled receptors family 1 profile domain-containing protein n=1 Tax=Sinanodonta woodiana TaxID=1069815 RepID=A0ABD3VLN6_SINWO
MANNITEPQTPANTVDTSVLEMAGHWYSTIHGYTSIIVCIFGICTNIINITVLARRDMRTPTNILLTWMAVSDILTMLPYVPFAIHFYCVNAPNETSAEKLSYHWVMFMLFLINFVATTHTISIWLCVSLSVFRFVQLNSTTKGPIARQRRIRQVKVIIFIVYVLSAVLLIPNYMTNETGFMKLVETNKTIYFIEDLKLASNETKPIVLANVLTYAIVHKIIPCVLMIAFGGSLLISLNLRGRKRRRRLSTTSTNMKKETRQSKTTRMLLVVIILFLVTELPQGILIILSATVSGFFQTVYMPLGDMMDFIALVNNAINFVLYCTMSNQFRSRFFEMYFKRTSSLKKLNTISLPTSIHRTTFTSVHDS